MTALIERPVTQSSRGRTFRHRPISLYLRMGACASGRILAPWQVRLFPRNDVATGYPCALEGVRMRRALTTVLIAAIIALAAVASAAPPQSSISRVVIVLSPYLTWNDVDSSRAPTLSKLAEQGAVGNLNVQNRNRTALQPNTPEQSVLTLSAGAWAALDLFSPSAYTRAEEYNTGTAGEAFERMTGSAADSSNVVYLGMPRLGRLSASGGTLDVIPGTLGGEIATAGGATAAVGNSDSGHVVIEALRSRPAALLAMDYEGRVRFGDVSPGLLRDDPHEPFGVATDLSALSQALDDAERGMSAVAGPQLLVVDSGDLSRVTAVEHVTSPALTARQHASAVRTLDSVVARVWETLPDDGLLMVLTPIEAETSETVPGLAPAIVYGPGYTGRLTSSSTQRSGLVTNLDVAATILDVFGIERPVQVLGSAITSDGLDSGAQDRIADLVAMDRTAMAIDYSKARVVNAFIGSTLLVLLLSTWLLIRANKWPDAIARRCAVASRVALLGVLSVPLASLVMFIVDGEPGDSAAAVLTLLVVTVVIWAVLLVIRRFSPLHIPVAVVSLATTAVILVDQWTGATWSFTSFLGYSPIMAARFYGIGNEGAAILYGTTLLGLAFAFDAAPDSRITILGRRWLVPIVGLLVVLTSAAPFMGANVGVAAWGIIGFAVAWALMNGHRISWKLALASLLVVILLVGVFSYIDLSGESGSQTHLGRAWQSAGQGGVGELWLIVQRKAETNLRVLMHTNWSFILIGMLAFIGFMRWHPRGEFARTLEENPHYSAAMAAALLGGLAAYFTEDSGIVIPALIMLYVGAGILYLMTARLSAQLAVRNDTVHAIPLPRNRVEVPDEGTR